MESYLYDYNTIPEKGDEHYDCLMRNYCDHHKFTFDIFYNDPIVKDMDKINPIKQKEVARLCHIMRKYNFVKSAWIIGSSTTIACTIYSDVDIIVETTIPP